VIERTSIKIDLFDNKDKIDSDDGAQLTKEGYNNDENKNVKKSV
jgi:hypothetical protein